MFGFCRLVSHLLHFLPIALADVRAVNMGAAIVVRGLNVVVVVLE
jgi:hypothetical protein